MYLHAWIPTVTPISSLPVGMGMGVAPKPLKFWLYNWPWTYQIACPVAQYNGCSACIQVNVQYQAKNGQWITAPGGLTTMGPSYAPSCAMGYNVKISNGWGSPMAAGTKMWADWEMAAFDGTTPGCNGQFFNTLASQSWTYPEGP
jgi:hypothetical protein